MTYYYYIYISFVLGCRRRRRASTAVVVVVVERSVSRRARLSIDDVSGACVNDDDACDDARIVDGFDGC